MTQSTPVRFRTQPYWWIFAGMVVVALVLRCTIFVSSSSHQRALLSLAFLIGSFSLMIGLIRIAYRALRAHLMTHHWQRCLELLIPRWGWQMTGWLNSSEDYGDPVLAGLKVHCRRQGRWIIISMFIIVIVSAILGL